MAESEGEQRRLNSPSLLERGELSVEDWCRLFSDLPKEVIELIVADFDDARVRGLINACIEGRLMAVQAENNLSNYQEWETSGRGL